MTHMVHCIKLKKEAPGLTAPPYPGKKGEWIYNNISLEAWGLWQQHQTRLINEKHLSLIAPETRQYLTEQMDAFFSDGDYDQVEGFIPDNRKE